MEKSLFLEIVAEMRDHCLDDYEIKINNKTYKFIEIDKEEWVGEGKYQTKCESGQLIEVDENYNIVEKFPFGIVRSGCKTGSYYTEWHYQWEAWEPYRLVEELVPEVIIPAHTEIKWEPIVEKHFNNSDDWDDWDE